MLDQPPATLFLVELSMARATFDDGRLLGSVLAVAGERVAARGQPLRFVAAAYLPDETRVLCLVEAGSIDAVRRVFAFAGLSSNRVSRALPVVHLDHERVAT